MGTLGRTQTDLDCFWAQTLPQVLLLRIFIICMIGYMRHQGHSTCLRPGKFMFPSAACVCVGTCVMLMSKYLVDLSADYSLQAQLHLQVQLKVELIGWSQQVQKEWHLFTEGTEDNYCYLFICFYFVLSSLLCGFWGVSSGCQAYVESISTVTYCWCKQHFLSVIVAMKFSFGVFGSELEAILSEKPVLTF